MKKLIVLISLFCLNSAFSQYVYKCTINGKIVYSNDEKDKKCQQLELKEMSILSVEKLDSKIIIKKQENNTENVEKTEDVLKPKPKKEGNLYFNSIPSALKILELTK